MFPLRLLPGVKTGYLVTLWVTICLGETISNGLVQCHVCRVTSHGIRNPTNVWNPESKFHWQRIRNPVPGIRNPRRGVQSPRLYWKPLRAWGSNTMMARPIRALELHYPMIQFLIKKDILHSSNSKIDRKGPRYNEHTFLLSLGPFVISRYHCIMFHA